ncbi:18353_t:CDS:1, partial [Funneliformis geosporum]
EKKVETNIDDKMKTGFDQFLVCMDSYLDLIKISKIDSAQTK